MLDHLILNKKSIASIYKTICEYQVMKNNKFINKIICADTLDLLPQIEESSIDVVLTDPPTFWINWTITGITMKFPIKTINTP